MGQFAVPHALRRPRLTHPARSGRIGAVADMSRRPGGSMKTEEFESYDGLGLAGLVRSGDVSATELFDAAIARVEARNPELNAVVSRLYDRARAAIGAGLPDGP